MTELSPDSILSHYRILSKIGAGGMGEVYLAQDTSELGRTVALKILPFAVAKDKDRLQRFTQEARTVSNLNHPNILTVYEFGQSDSASFIATEYIDGVTLRQHLSSRRLKLIDVLDVTIQIVAALNAAHEAGITHRDLKPENVMVRKDYIVKILDFGLAKLSDPRFATNASAGSEDATRMQVNTSPGIVMGTVSYMSPEQSVAKDVDHRTDIWSVGVLLYEMLAGVIPFPGTDIHRQIIAIQETEPAPLSQHVEGVPDRLEEIVAKCLAKDKNERYQTTKDLLIDLRNLRRKLDVDAEIERTVAPTTRSGSGNAAVSTQDAQTNIGATNTSQVRNTSSVEYVVSGIKQHRIAAAIAALVLVMSAVGIWAYLHARNTDTAIQSIAVMPFGNESGNADIEYLSDGMTETLISSLSQIPNLNVKARSLVFRYKGKDTNPQIVGRDLDVQAVLNGRVVQRGADLILYLELVDARSGNLIWGDQYNRKQADLVSLQGEIARDVSSKLKMKLTGAEEQKMMKNYTSNAEAYRLYLRGRFFATKRTAADAQRAIDSFNQAIAIDQNYALAYVGLAVGYSYLAIYGHTPSKEAFPKALQFAAKALELDNTLAEPHLTIGLLTFLQEHDIGAFERGTKRALELNPNSTDAHRLNGLRLLFLGRFDESLASLRRALEIEPLSLPGNLNYAYCLFYAGRIDEGEAHLKKTVELSPEFWLSHYYMSSIYRFKKDFAGAAEEFAIAKDLRGEAEGAKLIRDSFKKGGWQETLRAITTADPRIQFYPYDLATFYAELADKDRAFAKLNQAIEENDQYIGFMKVDPFMRPLHDDPRYREMLKKAGLPE
jgi:serine/threonine-protein kinase